MDLNERIGPNLAITQLQMAHEIQPLIEYMKEIADLDAIYNNDAQLTSMPTGTIDILIDSEQAKAQLGAVCGITAPSEMTRTRCLHTLKHLWSTPLERTRHFPLPYMVYALTDMALSLIHI